jgi:hypothetical protein
MQQIKPFGSFTPSAANLINGNFASLAALCRYVWYVDTLNGSDANDGTSQQTAFKTFAKAYGNCVAGKNDAVAVVADGTAASTVRIDASFTWDKNETHLLGICSGVNISNRARFAPSSTTTAFTPFFTVSANGCRFDNIEIFDGFTTGTTSQIAMVITGTRNLFTNAHIAGMGDTTSAGSTGSRIIKFTGGGENQFINCTIGLDTIARTAANASVEFASGTARNVFQACRFIAYLTGSGSGAFHAIATGNASMDRFQAFEECKFYQSVFSGSGVAMAELFRASTSAVGGEYILQSPFCAGVTAYGDATTKALTIVIGPAADKASGLGVVAT